MKNFLILPLYFYALTSLFAQSWDGGGGDTDWNNALNWDTDMVPIAGASVNFNQTVAVTGTGVVPPAQVRVNGGATLTLNLDMTIGDNVTAINAIQVANNGSLVIPAGRTIIVNPPDSHNGISNATSASNAQVTIEAGAIVNIVTPRHGISAQNSNFVFTNNGVINIAGASENGIRNNVSGASFINNGTINIGAPDRNGIINVGSFLNNTGAILLITSANRSGIDNQLGGSFINKGDITITDMLMTTNDGIFSNGGFTNDTDGMITINNMLDDGIAIIASTFTNNGEIMTTQRTGAATNNVGISVGSFSATATFINNGLINADGGTTTTGVEAIRIYSGLGSASLTNNGRINLSGGDPTRSLFSQGIVINAFTGTINTGNNRINISLGSFTNNGLIESNYPSGPAVITGASAETVNDGFFRTNDSNFSNGTGTVVDEDGVNLNDPTQTTLNLGGTCEVSIGGAGATQVWLNASGDVVDAAGPDLAFTNAFPSDPATITAQDLDNVTITIENLCAAALLPVELISFEATAKTNHVLLEWETATETNNDYIAVERSTNAKDFTEIGRRDGAGTSYTSISYSLEDKSPAYGINYYRLRQVDIDGTTTYSEFVSANFRGEIGEGNIRLYPNYVAANGSVELDLRTSTTELHSFTIRNSQGQVMKNYALSGGSLTPIQIGNWPAGMYFLYDKQSASTVRFVVLN